MFVNKYNIYFSDCIYNMHVYMHMCVGIHICISIGETALTHICLQHKLLNSPKSLYISIKPLKLYLQILIETSNETENIAQYRKQVK